MGGAHGFVSVAIAPEKQRSHEKTMVHCRNCDRTLQNCYPYPGVAIA